MRQEWEVARWINLYLALPYTKKGRNLQVTDICRFDWEKQKTKPEIKDREYINNLIRKWDRKR